MPRGYFGIGIEHTKTETNVGTLYRSASIFGASFIFTIGKRYKKQSSDTLQSWKQIPLFHFQDLNSFKAFIPFSCLIVGIENSPNATPISTYHHPERAIYLLGSEDNGLSKEAQSICNNIIIIPGKYCLNVSVAGSIVLFDRISKESNQ